MTGTLINACAIVICGILGTLIGKGIPKKTEETLMIALGILVLCVGIQYVLNGDNSAIIAVSIAAGIIVGEALDLDGKINRFGAWVQKKLTKDKSSDLGKGFITASLIFCVGAMGILGSIEDGLNGNYQILLLKSILDGILSLVLGASMGIGVALSAVPILIYQGTITLAAGLIQSLLNDVLMSNITAVGGIMIAAIGINSFKGISIRVSNMLPALLFVPLVMYLYGFLPV